MKKTEKKKVAITVIKKRGVKKGQKRGSYKKTTNEKNNIEITETNNINNDVNIDNTNVINNSDILHTESAKIESSDGINDGIIDNENNDVNKQVINEDELSRKNLDSFINEHGANDEFKESENINVNKNPFNKDEFKRVEKSYSTETKLIISGYMLLSICDFIIPNILLKVLAYFNDGYKDIKASSVKLTQEQKEQLKESADEVAKFVFATLNPLTVFFIGLGTFYFNNIQEQKSNL